ncbi:DNA adenine methylase [Haloprofundus halobius]|uniref:DNA adenine methylase n=1 Tax=Haloprofundus halobius TaxID=2876194 RepID=UPI001CCA9CD4|nr:DNA adenine methylase [Haloprofundus halobius]
MESLGFLESDGGRGRAPRVFYPVEADPAVETPGYTPRASNQSGTFPYPGSKSHLSRWIVDVMPTHDTYVEVFGGSAGVLYNKPNSKYEVYNDVNDDLTQFFTVLRDRPDDLAEWLQTVPYSRTQYNTWVEEFYAGHRPDDAIERAGRFFSLRYMQSLGVSNAPNGFKVRAKRSPARTFDNAKRRIPELADRFRDVTIENQHYREILTGYDDSSVDVLFYADPPYIGSEDHYNTEFDHEDFVDCLREVDGDWIVSYSTIPDGLEDYTVVEHQSQHRMRRGSGAIDEHLVCNFDPADRLSFRATIGD